MDFMLIAKINLIISLFIMTGGIVLFKYRAKVSAWASEMLKVHKSFLIRKGTLFETTLIAVLIIIIGLSFSAAFIFYIVMHNSPRI
jgi:hypothetical protein